MIGLKSFHLFFIALSVVLTGWFGYFEITSPTNPGNISIMLSIISLSLMVGLTIYGFNVYKKFKQI